MTAKVAILRKIKLHNFKSYKGDHEFTFPEGISSISGKNSIGKTTIADAFYWAAFGCGCDINCALEVPTLENGEKIDCDYHGVAMQLDFHEKGNPVLLQSVLLEKRYAKRKEDSNEYSYSYFINKDIGFSSEMAEVKKKEYDEYLSHITGLNSNILKVISGTQYFHSLDWKEKRRMVFDLCGEITDEDIILNNVELADLITYVGQDKAELVTKLKKETKKIETQEAEIDGALKELESQLEDISAKETELAEQLTAKEKEEKKHRDSITEMYNEFVVSIEDKMKPLLSRREELEKERTNKILELDKKANELLEQKRKLESKIYYAETSVTDNSAKILSQRSRYDFLKKELANLENSLEKVCRYCGADIAEEKILTNKEKEETRIKSQMASLVSEGKAITAMVQAKKEEATDAKKQLEALNEEIKEVGRSKDDFVNNHFSDLDEKIEELKATRNNNQALYEELKEEREKAIEPILREMKEIQRLIVVMDESKKRSSRIEELNSNKKQLAERKKEIESHLELIKTLNKKKIEASEDEIKKMFEDVDFKMYTTLATGDLKETCETIFNGVPYKSMSASEKINSAMQIIKTFSNCYEFFMPVFVDNAESVLELKETGHQIIRLEVKG